MNQEGLVYAFIFDGAGGARQIGWDEIRSWNPEKGPIWIHLDFTSEYARKWVQEESKIDEIAAEALLSEETRPRTTMIEDSALLSLRGVNLSPGSDPEDMVSIRIWLNKDRIVSTRRRTLLSVSDMVSSFKEKKGPKTTGEFLGDFTGRLTARMEDVVEDLEDRAAQMEENVLTAGSHALRSEISGIRRETIMLRRYLAPQREAMIKLYTEKIAWLEDNDRMRLREVTDQLIRHIEDLDSIRDRASVTQEELVNKLSEQMNSRMYVLSLVAALFLPLGFFTGLLGINVGGIPGAENKWGFFVFVLILVLVLVIQAIFFKKKKWL
jgi:zinc transporter